MKPPNDISLRSRRHRIRSVALLVTAGLVAVGLMVFRLAPDVPAAMAQSVADHPIKTDPVRVAGGGFHSVLPEVVGEPIRVESFYMDPTAVTNGQFREFLQDNPEWQRDEVPALFADKDYLRHWQEDGVHRSDVPDDLPVTRVSWFAAGAYCDWAGGRLPTLNEWEYAAQAMDFETVAQADHFASELIGWYSAVDAGKAAPVGSTGIENRYGVKDLFGLIMEWVEDFKPPVGSEISLDCGTMGRMQGDASVYSYGMAIRYITRMSFQPTTTTGMIGFRCVYDQPPNRQEARK